MLDLLILEIAFKIDTILQEMDKLGMENKEMREKLNDVYQEIKSK